MTLVRWNPWGDLFSLHNQMDQLFQSLTEESSGAGNGGGRPALSLPVDIRQTDEAFFIQASVPGFKPEDVEVTFDDGVLTINGTHRQQSETEDKGWVRRERRVGSVFRQISLPSEVRSEEISANFEHGVLTITVPRAQKAQPKRIPVRAGGSAAIDAPSRESAS